MSMLDVILRRALVKVLDYWVLQRALVGVDEDYAFYLRETANEVDKLISDYQTKDRFIKPTEQFVAMFYAHKAAVKEVEERIERGELTDSVLLLRGAIKDTFKGLPLNPTGWFPTHDDTETIGSLDLTSSISKMVENIKSQQNRTELTIDEQQELKRCIYHSQPEPPRDPEPQERLMCCYVRLNTIHDLVLTSPQDTPIFFKPNYEGYPNPLEVAGCLWHRIAAIGGDKTAIETEKGLTNKALAEVKRDLETDTKQTSSDKIKQRSQKRRRKTPPQLLKEAREREAVKELSKNPNLTSEELGKLLGCHKSTVVRLKAWQNRGVLANSTPPKGFKKQPKDDKSRGDIEAIDENKSDNEIENHQ